MPEFGDIRQALADSLSDIPGLQESPYVLSNPTPPYAEVMPSEIDYDLTMSRGTDESQFIVRVLVGQTGDIAAQKKLDKFLAPTGALSIKTALETTELDGIEDLHVTKCSGYRAYRQGSVPVLGAEWTVRVHTTN